MFVSKDIDLNAPLTKEQKKMLKDMNRSPIVYDEDCPELTDEQLSKMYRVADSPRANLFNNNDAQ